MLRPFLLVPEWPRGLGWWPKGAERRQHSGKLSSLLFAKEANATPGNVSVMLSCVLPMPQKPVLTVESSPARRRLLARGQY